jgi:hypothetical protein
MSTQPSRWLWSGATVAVIWICLAAMIIWAPPLISGSAQEHLPLVAITAWVWALLATGFVVMAPAVTEGNQARVWGVYFGAVSVLWIVAAVVSIAAPSMVTGTDPTSIPIAGMLAPVFALIATAFATVAVVAIAAKEATLGSRIDEVVARFAEPLQRPI